MFDKFMSALPTPIQGVFWMVLATLMFAGTNTAAKHMGQSYDVIQVVWGRYFFHLLIMMLFLHVKFTHALKSKHTLLQLTRSTLLLVASGFYFTGFTLLPLAESAAVINVTPILATILAIVIMGEKAGIYRWIGIIAGFIGALIIIRPGSEVFNTAVFYPLGAACAYSLYQLATRHVGKEDSAMTSIVYTSLVGAVLCSAIVPFFWTTPDMMGWLLLASLGLTGALGHYGMIRAYAIAEVSLVSPLTYIVLIWMIMSGYIIFGDVPDVWTVVGAAFIAGSGIYISHRERLRAKDNPAPKVLT